MSAPSSSFFFFNDTATTEISPLSLHDALPIYARQGRPGAQRGRPVPAVDDCGSARRLRVRQVLRPPRRSVESEHARDARRSEEHTSELQSRPHLVCRLLLEKKKI